jgi:hypothetical protein
MQRGPLQRYRSGAVSDRGVRRSGRPFLERLIDLSVGQGEGAEGIRQVHFGPRVRIRRVLVSFDLGLQLREVSGFEVFHDCDRINTNGRVEALDRTARRTRLAGMMSEERYGD